jgi:hypothetical protein
MAGIDQTLIVDYQHSVTEQEMRNSKYGLIDAAKKHTKELPFMNPELEKKVAEYASGNAIEIPALSEDVITVASTESFDIPVNGSTSAITSLSFTTLFTGFSLFPAEYDNNVITIDQVRSQKIAQCDKAMGNALEDNLDTWLNTYKTQVWAGAEAGISGGIEFDTVNDVLKVPLADQKDIFFANLMAMAQRNDWSDNVDLVANPNVIMMLSEYMKYGAANEKNLMFQALPNLFLSNRVTNETGKRGSAYLLEPGAFGILPNYKSDFRNRTTVGEAKWDITNAPLPRLGFNTMLYENKVAVNAANVGTYSSHAIMSHKLEYGFIFRYALLKRYNSSATTRVGNILKINLEMT